jgi:hypothetical protein
LHYLAPRKTHIRDKPEDIITQSIICFVIILASVTCLKPVLRPFDGETFGSRAARSTSSKRYATGQDTTVTQNTYYELSEVHAKHQPSPDPSKNHVGWPELSLQANSTSEDDEMPLNQRERTTSNKNGVFRHSAHAEYVEHSNGDDFDGIRKDLTWSVRAARM